MKKLVRFLMKTRIGRRSTSVILSLALMLTAIPVNWALEDLMGVPVMVVHAEEPAENLPGELGQEGEGQQEGVDDQEGQGQEEGADDQEGQGQEEGVDDQEGQGQEEGADDQEGQGQEEGADDQEGQGQEEGADDQEGQGQEEGADDQEGQGQEEGTDDQEGQGQEEETDQPDEPVQTRSVTPRAEAITFFTLEDFVAYSKDTYAVNPLLCSKDIITLALSGSGTPNVFPKGYVGLGTTDIPFDGKIIIATSESTYWFAIYNPLFTNVTDSVRITNNNDSDILLELKRKKTIPDDSSEEEDNVRLSPLFAKKVTHAGTGGVTWKIKHTSYDNGINDKAYAFSGLIGTIGQDSTITIEFESSSKTASEFSSVSVETITNDLEGTDAGMVAGTIEQNASVTLTLTGNNTKCNITSANGNAGGLIGSMNAGASLTIQSISYIPDADKTIRADNGYAGGIVGKSDGANIIVGSNTLTVNGTIKGGNGAGGAFGYYSNLKNAELVAQNASFDLTHYSINCTVESGVAAGGLFGVLDGMKNVSIENSSLTVAKADANGAFGGICGVYKTSDLKNELLIHNTTVNTSAAQATSFYGGLAGKINDAVGSQPAYVKAYDFTHTSTGGYSYAECFGGVVGSAGNLGSMLDIGTVTISTGGNDFHGGGIVGNLETGVMRLSGTTTMTNAPAASGSRSYGQLVGIRDQALVYAIGTGNTGDAGWTYNRSTKDNAVDDIGSWGEVVRTSNIEDKAAVGETPAVVGILTFDKTNHTVTVKAPVITNISSVNDFAKTALNLQLNEGNVGSLLFADSANEKTSLMADTITFSANIDLAGSGFTGLMRDDQLGDNDLFCGTIKAADSAITITLAIGQRYGVYGTATSYAGRGAICAHRYNGLLSRTGTGASVEKINITGSVIINQKVDNVYVGGVVAEVTDGINAENINVSESISLKGNSKSNTRVGGYIGVVASDNANNIVVSGTSPTNSCTMDISGLAASHSVGGAIGYINSTESFSVNVTNLIVSANISATGSLTHAHFAGLIADIVENGTSDTRTVNLTSVTIKGTTISNGASGNDSSSGGMLGYSWHNANVNFSAVSLIKNGSTNNSITTGAKALGGLVYVATGHWSIPANGIEIKSLQDLRSAGTSFGMLVNKGFNERTAGLYLDLTSVDSYKLYNTVGANALAAAGDITVINCTVYDELVAYSGKGGDCITNGNGVISITTSSSGDIPTFFMSGDTCNTYQNKFNTSKVNGNSRYYYNLNYIKLHLSDNNGGKSDAKKLLFWSLEKYATTNIQGNFSGGAISGDCDLQYISYYPIDVQNVTIANDISLTFYNSLIESMEGAANGNTDSNIRSTHSASQHYLMHGGLFINVSGTLETKGNVHLKGNIVSDATHSGTLISGILSGSLKTASNKEIVLEGITMSNVSGALLVNKISGADQIVQVNGVRTGGLGFEGVTKASETAYDANVTVAESLIGDVVATNLTLKFDRIKLDARTSATGGTYYNTTKSIFSNATLLNKLDVDLKTNAEYNFAESEDWSKVSGTATHRADVTYGKELTSSLEYQTNSVSDEQWYYDDTRNYVNAAGAPSGTSGSDFSSGYLPYVRYYSAALEGAPAPINTLREIKVNVKVSNLTEGCGTYDHPYIINDPVQIVNIAKMIAGTATIPSIRLPKTKATTSNNYNNHWCKTDGSTETCAIYTYGSSYTSTASGAASWGVNEVREYLASAYYQIDNEKDIIITNAAFPGLGTFRDSGKYAFRGIIIGKSGERTAKIINKTKAPLINFCTGAVIKNINIEVEWPENDPFVSYNGGNSMPSEYSLADDDCKAYGALIGKIYAGDTIIDNVSVSFTVNHPIEITAGSAVTDSNQKMRNVAMTPVGGYIGTVIDGCVIFRNMSAKTATGMGLHVNSVLSTYSYTDVQVDSTKKNVPNDSNDTNYDTGNGKLFLYVNPIIGRVINGFAINETSAYRYSEDGYYGDGLARVTGGSTVTLKNGRKNYSIADINKDSSTILQFSGTNSVNVFAPDAQSLYILSGILLIGAGTASSTTGDYNYSTAYNNGSSNGKYNATHHANYSAIGSQNAEEKTLVAEDTVNSRKAIPYIVKKYTEKDTSNNYPARMLTGSGGNRKLYLYLCAKGEQTSDPAEDAQDTIYYMPDGFRGLGSFSKADNSNKNLYLKCFDGRDKTVDMNAVYKSVRQDKDNYYRVECKMGPGLFINLRQDGISSGGTGAQTDRNKTIGNVTISGYISGEAISPLNGTYIDGQAYTVFTGGIVGYYNGSSINIGNVVFKNLHLFGSHHVGGMIGYYDKNTCLYINNFEAIGERGLQVEAWSRAGGLIGAFDQGALYVNTLPNAVSEFKISSVENVGKTNRNTSNKEERQAGGLVGNIWADGQQILIKNVSIVSKDANSCVSCSNENYSLGNSSAGGIVGQVGKKGKLSIVDCSVDGITIKGYYAGGLVGANGIAEANAYTKIYDSVVNDSDITGYMYAGGIIGYDNATNETYSSTSDSKFIDPNDNTKKYLYDISGCLVKDCNIKHTNAGEWNGTGGLVGKYDFSSAKVRVICNTKVDNCTLSSPGDKDCTGGIIGICAKTKVFGYNISVNDLTFKKGDAAASGDFLKQAGNLIGKATYGEIKLIGVSRQGTLVSKTTSQNDIDISSRLNSPAVFVVYGDYDGTGIALDNSAHTWGTTGENTGDNTKTEAEIRNYAEELVKVSSFNDDNNLFTSETSNRFPYVNVSPYTIIGKNGDSILEVVNGDGAKTYTVTTGEGENAITNTYPLIKKITEDRTSSKRYSVPDVYVEASGDYARMATAITQTDDAYNKISTYKTEMGSLPGTIDDFAVVVINSEDETLATAIINNYIKAVTNTNIDYKTRTDSSNRYKLEIYACTYDSDNNMYVINDSATPGLRLDSSGNYFMTASGADTNKKHDQFSLIDVQYLDPADTTNTRVVMHVYIPVLTKKMLKYTIETASLSGTDYKVISGENANYVYGNPLCESMKAWFTSYVSYGYSASELQALVDSGIGLKWHNDKTLLFEYSETTAVSDKLAADTQMVLVDPNKRRDEFYYSRLSLVRQDVTGSETKEKDEINLSSFKTNIETGDSFVPIDLRELVLNNDAISVTEYVTGATTGYDYIVSNETDGTIAYKNGSSTIYLKFSEDGAGTGTHKVTITKNVTENYYLSILIKSASASDKNIFNFKVTAPIYLSGTMRARRSDYNVSKITNILMADLYEQKVWLTVKNNGGDHELIDATNHALEVTMIARIGLKGSASEKSLLLTHLSNPNIKLNQEFIVYLTRYDYDGELCKVLGKPSVSASFAYKNSAETTDDGSTGYATPVGWSTQNIPSAEGGYIELNPHDIKSYLSANQYTYLRAYAVINYENDNARTNGFPKRSGEERNIGVNVSTASNLSYSDSAIAYSNMTKKPDTPDSKYFYIRSDDKTSLTFDALEGIPDVYDKDGLSDKSKNMSQLGLNPKNFVDGSTTRIPIYCTSSYDATKIKKNLFITAERIQYTLELYKKTDNNGTVEYVKVSNIGNYVDLTQTAGVNIKSCQPSGSTLYNFTGTFELVGTDKLVYQAPINASGFTAEGQQMFEADIDFQVITGTGFTEHANYRMVLQVDLVKQVNGAWVAINGNTNAFDWVVYTNAKINPAMLSSTEISPP